MKIDIEFKNLIPALTQEEFAGLENSIKAEGCREAIITWNDTIVDGHNRYEICTRHNIPFRTCPKDFADRNDAKIWIIKNQFSRRNLNNYQRAELGLKLKEVLEKKSKEKESLRKAISQTMPIDPKDLNVRQKAILEVLSSYKNTGSAYATPDNIYFVQNEDKVKIGCSSNIDNRLKDINKHLPDARLVGSCKGDITLEKSLHKALHEHRLNGEWFKLNNTTVSIIKAFVPDAVFDQLVEVNSRKEIAKIFNIGEGTLSRVKTIKEKAAPEVIEKIRSGDKSINEVYKEIRKQEKLQAIEKREEEFKKSNRAPSHVDIYTTDRRYNIIYADPPWQYWEGGHKAQSVHYNTMSIDDICALPVSRISDNDCILFLWVTFPILEDAFKVIQAWGFNYSTCGFCWIKKNKAGSNFFGCGGWTRANSELCLIGIKGSVTRLDNTISQVIEQPREEHSKKPDVVRSLITRLVGELPRIELFARAQHDGWDCWGNHA